MIEVGKLRGREKMKGEGGLMNLNNKQQATNDKHPNQGFLLD
jgi:hypothetical protein